MKKIVLIWFMRVLFPACIFFGVPQVAAAPGPDFQQRIARLRAIIEYGEMIYHRMEFDRFVKDLGARESGNNWKSINCIGCFGEWQFAESTVKYLGYKGITVRKFRKDPDIFPQELQRKVLESLIKVNLALLKDYEHYIGKTVGGVEVTKSGLIAASHLGGARSVKLFLKSDGRIDKKDVLGTSVCNYMRKFRDYDLGEGSL